MSKERHGGYFNSHPRVGGDMSWYDLIQYSIISIRTPAWGVTRVFQHSGAMQSISIRTPAWGVTDTAAV